MRVLRKIATGLFCVSCAAPTPLYRSGELSSTWSPLRDTAKAKVFHNAHGGSVMTAISCDPSDERAPLDSLTHHLLIDFTERERLQRDLFVLGGREALRTRWNAKLEGVPIALDLVVLKKNGCVIDYALVAARDKIDQRRADFERFMLGFAESKEK
jgi:hypothetical protein